MAYLPRRNRVSRALNGLGDASSCGADQIWDPNAQYPGLPPGQCMPRSSYTAAQIAALDAQNKASSGPGIAASIFGALLGGLVTPSPTPGVIAAPASSGISTGTALAIGAGAIALIVIATR